MPSASLKLLRKRSTDPNTMKVKKSTNPKEITKTTMNAATTTDPKAKIGLTGNTNSVEEGGDRKKTMNVVCADYR